jgi:hypothetical protein
MKICWRRGNLELGRCGRWCGQGNHSHIAIIILAPSLPSPSLSFYQQDPTTLVFNWGPGTYVLTSSTNVNGPYTDLSAATSPYSVTIGSDPQKYFRLRVQ